ncbi:DnaB-like helicase C-terminal domain-containing protein [Nitrolancea hollandica]|uniref:SF4 helicase domain-containing protein n=1 Tax=Nitrolancea hollandica Lb TaxID=1129897 RepID=I4EFJ8_9BACT|nr:DnaB-like helicase C-terminal domain-containing protein [Nitrolancea hollandica]CCF83460.1 hypothetical protein NITHO_2310003 [Nitrolancea hollandica Lb]
MRSELLPALEQLAKDAEVWYTTKEKTPGLSTGFDTLDYYTLGLQPGEVTILAARPGIGKTSLAMQIATNIAQDLFVINDTTGENPGQVLYFSPEMSTWSLALRMTCQWSGINSMDFRRGQVTEEQMARWHNAREALKALDPHLRIRGGTSMDVVDVVATVQDAHRHGPPVAAVFIDYLTRLDYSGNNNTYVKATEVSRRLKNLSNELRIPIVALAQFGRPEKGKEDEPPTMFDLRDSGNIEQDADNVWILHRSVKHRSTDSDSDGSTGASLFLAKARNGDSEVEIVLGWKATLTQYIDYGREEVAL